MRRYTVVFNALAPESMDREDLATAFECALDLACDILTGPAIAFPDGLVDADLIEIDKDFRETLGGRGNANPS